MKEEEKMRMRTIVAMRQLFNSKNFNVIHKITFLNNDWS